MPRKGRYKALTLKSIVPFTVYVQYGHLQWVKSIAGARKASVFIDQLLGNTRVRYEARRIRATMRIQRKEIARLQALVVQLGGTYEPVSLNPTQEQVDAEPDVNEELQ